MAIDDYETLNLDVKVEKKSYDFSKKKEKKKKKLNALEYFMILFIILAAVFIIVHLSNYF